MSTCFCGDHITSGGELCEYHLAGYDSDYEPPRQYHYDSDDEYVQHVPSSELRRNEKGRILCTANNNTCTKVARDAQTRRCIVHKGGHRCLHEECTRGAVSGYSYCTSHGGGRKCAYIDEETGSHCFKAAQGGTEYCVFHTGGYRCVYTDCTKSAVAGNQEFHYKFCKRHLLRALKLAEGSPLKGSKTRIK